MTDYTKMDAPTLLHEMGTDATKWAAAFCQIFPDHAELEEDLVGWFASPS